MEDVGEFASIGASEEEMGRGVSETSDSRLLSELSNAKI